MPAGNEKIEIASQQSYAGDIVVLYELDLTRLNGDVLRFTPFSAGEDTSRSALIWGGEVYTPQPIEVTGYDKVTGQQFPRPKMVVSNIGGVLNSTLQEFDDLIGVDLTRIKTLRQFLDDGEDPDPDARWSLEIYTIHRKSVANALRIEFELASKIDQEGKFLPGRTVHRNACDLIYRSYDPLSEATEISDRFIYSVHNGCPYAGSGIFNPTDDVVQEPEHDICGKRLSSCQKRFGVNEWLPIQAFPGVGRVR